MSVLREFLKKLSVCAAAAAALCFACTSAFAGSLSLEFTPVPSDGDKVYAVEYETAMLGKGKFDPRTMTADSQVLVNFVCENPGNECPVELIWQSWGYHTNTVNNWSRVKAADYGDGYAVFNYSDIVDVYGTDDFSEVYTIIVRDTGRSVTVSDVTVTNLTVPGDETTASETSAETETEPVSETDAASEENVTESIGEVSEGEVSVTGETGIPGTPAPETEPQSASPEITSQTQPATVPAAVTSVSQTERAPEQKKSEVNIKLIFILGVLIGAAAVVVIVLIIKKKKRRGNRFY